MLMILTLIQAIENDDERAVVERIFHQYYKFMMVKANDILHHYHDAEDAVMEAFRCISQNVKPFMNLGRDDTAALVSIYTRNIAINMYNRKKKLQEIIDMSGDVEDCQACGEDPQALIINDETIELVRAAIDRLDDKYRDVIILKYYYHMKNVDIANVMKLELNTVNSHIFRARGRLKDIIGEEGYERITYGQV